MFRILGEHLHKQFKSELDLNKMRLDAIKNDYVSHKKGEVKNDKARGDTQFNKVER